MISLKDISYKVGKKLLLNNVSMEFETEKIHMIVGPNGAGKSTLLKSISGSLEASGKVIYTTPFGQKELNNMGSKELAKTRSVLLQDNHCTAPFKVHEIVEMGVYARSNKKLGDAEQQLIDHSIKIAGVSHLRERIVFTLSGGEQQRVHFARTLAQLGNEDLQGKYLLLDEPVSALDVQYQHELLETCSALTAKGLTIIIVIHDLNLAMQYADKVLLLNKGQKINCGNPQDVLNTDDLEKIYGIPFLSFKKDDQVFIIPQSGSIKTITNRKQKSYVNKNGKEKRIKV